MLDLKNGISWFSVLFLCCVALSKIMIVSFLHNEVLFCLFYCLFDPILPENN
jgi:hypothetical protein